MPVLDVESIERLRSVEGIDGPIEIQRRLRLMDLRMARPSVPRMANLAPDTYRQALDTFIWGLPPDRNLTIAFAFDGDGAFSLHIQLSAKGRNREDVENQRGRDHVFQQIVVQIAVRLRHWIVGSQQHEKHRP